LHPLAFFLLGLNFAILFSAIKEKEHSSLPFRSLTILFLFHPNHFASRICPLVHAIFFISHFFGLLLKLFISVGIALVTLINTTFNFFTIFHSTLYPVQSFESFKYLSAFQNFI
jgi:hypothetical protein